MFEPWMEVNFWSVNKPRVSARLPPLKVVQELATRVLVPSRVISTLLKLVRLLARTVALLVTTNLERLAPAKLVSGDRLSVLPAPSAKNCTTALGSVTVVNPDRFTVPPPVTSACQAPVMLPKVFRAERLSVLFTPSA